MKFFIAILSVAALVAFASAATLPEFVDSQPLEEIDSIDDPSSDVVVGQELDALAVHSRQRRFTCDVFSFSSQWATPNHSACALKCVGKGRKGGHCENNRCVCRDDHWVG